MFVRRFDCCRVVVFLLLFVPLISRSANFTDSTRYHPDRILIKPKATVNPVILANFHSTQKAEIARTFKQLGNIQVLRLAKGETLQNAIINYERSGLVEYAERDYRVRLALTSPNDPAYLDGSLWGLNNSGENGGLADADIDAPEGWTLLTSASNIVVAVVDTGVRYTHQDLALNMWVNPQDGGHGLNVLNGTNNPDDDSGHGTLIAGILGADGNNGAGTVGVAWQAQIMACKFADNSGGSISDAIACIDYARTNGAKVINASWGLYEFSFSLSNAIHEARSADIIVVAAAGNDVIDTDVRPYYPASLELDNVIAVAATTRRDDLYRLSNFGAATVDLAAPGEEIYSTYRLSDDSYRTDQGTSMAAAYVSGVCALARARFPAESAQQIRNRVLAGTDLVPSLAAKCVTGGRLNLRTALGLSDASPASLATLPPSSEDSFRLRLSGDPERCYLIECSTNLMNWSSIFTNVTAPDGTFVFTDSQANIWPQRFYRALSVP